MNTFKNVLAILATLIKKNFFIVIEPAKFKRTVRGAEQMHIDNDAQTLSEEYASSYLRTTRWQTL